ncbi:MAG: aminotransferase class III-fold pyridoxal phosphate-dependent enzyme [Candidatus Omnitrophica bacterium]|nr:aminotransferase class III-fold pyridoxal phosphate-dependent enzyme [Candidatus Omnitrophota bacterium]
MDDKELLEMESKYCSWGDTVHYAKQLNIFRESDGIYLYDSQGRQYVDLQMWYSAANFGYKNRRLNDVLKKQIDTLPQLACQYLHEEKIRLAAKISQDIEKKFGVKGRVHFNVGGAQAIEDAIKVVRNHTGKIPMFSFMGGYHGRTLAATAITSSYRYREHYGHFSDRAHFVPYPYCFRCPEGKSRESCGLACLRRFEKLFESEYYSLVNPKNKNCEYGAFFVEPVQATGGYIVPPMDYFKELKKTLDKYHVLFVADEIQMGFYRTGKLWSIEHFGVVPDIIVFGKALTNGLNPISGIWAKEELISPEVFPPGMTHSTFSSNPLGTAAGLAVMDLIEDSNFDVDVPKRGAYFLKQLKNLQKKYPSIGQVDGLGLALRIEICQKDGFTPDRDLTDRIMNIGLGAQLTAGGKKRGLVLDIGGYYKNVFTLAPSLYITEDEIDLSVMLFEEALQKALGA